MRPLIVFQPVSVFGRLLGPFQGRERFGLAGTALDTEEIVGCSAIALFGLADIFFQALIKFETWLRF